MDTNLARDTDIDHLEGRQNELRCFRSNRYRGIAGVGANIGRIVQHQRRTIVEAKGIVESGETGGLL